MPESEFIDPAAIKTFTANDLVGRRLDVLSQSDEDGCIIYAIDIKTKECFLLDILVEEE